MNIKYLIPSLSLLFFLSSCNKTEKEETLKKDTIQEEETVDEELKAPSLIIKNIIKPIVFEYTSTGCPGLWKLGKTYF